MYNIDTWIMSTNNTFPQWLLLFRMFVVRFTFFFSTIRPLFLPLMNSFTSYFFLGGVDIPPPPKKNQLQTKLSVSI